MIRVMGKTDPKPVALVTGCSRGIGCAIAERLCKEGYLVIANVRSSTSIIRRVRREFNEKGYDVQFIRADISNERQVRQMLRLIADRSGALDVVVSNAGTVFNKTDETCDTITNQRLKKYFDVNVWGGVFVLRYALPLLKKSKRGRVIFINSAVSFIGTGRRFGYAISKTTNVGLVRALSLELAQYKVTVNAIVPGYVRTRMVHLPGKELKKKLDKIPMRRLGSPHEIGYVASFLASPEAGYITGQHIHINGGMYMA